MCWYYVGSEVYNDAIPVHNSSPVAFAIFMGKLNFETGNENDSNKPTMRNGKTEKDKDSNTKTKNDNMTKETETEI